jgi:hypothetical protein
LPLLGPCLGLLGLLLPLLQASFLRRQRRLALVVFGSQGLRLQQPLLAGSQCCTGISHLAAAGSALQGGS